MAIEIERKFLVVGDDWRAQASRRVPMRQGYLTEDNGKSSIRVRLQGEPETVRASLGPGERPATDGRAAVEAKNESAPGMAAQARTGGEARLNIKAAVVGRARAEYDYEVPVKDAHEILDSLCVGLVDKVRHYIDVRDPDGQPLTWEIDEFAGANAGLVVAEIELRHNDQRFDSPAWLGAEVTEDRRYYNHSLALHPWRDWPENETGNELA